MASLSDTLKALPQFILPQHTLSLWMHKLARSEKPWLKNAIIKSIVKNYNVDMSLAKEENPLAYKSFNDFFTRELKDGARPVASGEMDFVSPVDGAISQLGPIEEDRIMQAKGHDYSVNTLLGGEDVAKPFIGGDFMTIYLSPRDYHRIHMPCDGVLKSMLHVPGKLFAVNRHTVRAVPEVFARNERVVAIFDTEWGPLAMVLVGAIFVGSIETVWAGEVTPPTQTQIREWEYDDNRTFKKGEEMGRFNMGSTVILVTPPGMTQYQAEMAAETVLQMGQKIGEVKA